jgi:preprotein translocase subunit SecB
MADDNTPPQPGGNGADNQPHVAALMQYVKDLSVENPSAPQAFQWQVQPQVDVQFNINVERVADEVHEVALKILVAARSEQGPHFIVDLTYAGLFGLRNIPEDALAPFLLVEAPRLLFPFARQVIAEAIQNAGFPPLLLEPIDFGAAFVQQLEAAQAAQGQGDAPASEPAEAAAETTATDD